MFSAATIAHVLKQRFKLKELPFDTTLADAGLGQSDLITVQQRIWHTLGKTVEVTLADTVYTITDKVNAG